MRHLLDIESLSRETIEDLLGAAATFVTPPPDGGALREKLKGRLVINLFFENSTRTRASFEIAAKRLGADVVNITSEASSIKKGETLLDMAATLNAMRPDALILRHPDAGAPQLLAQKMGCAVINAGDGAHEHPTQALLDALTIRRHRGGLPGLRIALCGDIAHSRVARSNIQLLVKMGASVRAVAPPTLMPAGIDALGVAQFFTMEEGIRDCHVVMMLRLQRERMQGAYVPSLREYYHFYGLDSAKLAHAAPDALVLHPGPMNRGIEIDGAVADDIAHSRIEEQVAMGVAVRMACLEWAAR
ncbi:MAG TPA: aspartate carbamoyltransferase catalytic subunit [Dongiaceae bacterium]|jgi:aspartate carbamoyltransferase catalytic subunit|nr:aspartate carbamoyltransferase catalytic subunit [Dongiaceae bacterium]